MTREIMKAPQSQQNLRKQSQNQLSLQGERPLEDHYEANPSSIEFCTHNAEFSSI